MDRIADHGDATFWPSRTVDEAIWILARRRGREVRKFRQRLSVQGANARHLRSPDLATVRQRKTGHPIRFELTEQAREAIDAYMKKTAKRPGDYL